MIQFDDKKTQLLAAGATYSEVDKGFIAGDSFFPVEDVSAENDEDFQDTLELVKISLWKLRS